MKSIVTVFLVGIVLGYIVAGIEMAEVRESDPSIDVEENAVRSDDVDVRPSDVVEASMSSIVDEKIGVRFLYRTDPHTQMITEIKRGTESDATFVKGYQLALRSDFESMEERGAGEGPPTITLTVFKNEQKLFPRLWATQFPLQSNIELARTDPQEVLVGDSEAVRYLVDGLYSIDTFVVTHDKYIYVVSGAYMDDNSLIRRDFLSFIESIEFLPSV